MQSLTTGTMAGIGTFRCVGCDYVVALSGADELPTCPGCGGQEFVRASLFTDDVEESRAQIDDGDDTWLATLRSDLDIPGEYLAYRDEDEEVHVFPLTREWTRVGRSLAADVRFDDPTVSRRHALIVRQPDGVRVLDDRSLNGVFVNGERVEWSTLRDGDEILVGRHRLCFVDVPIVSGMRDEGAREHPLHG
jgi:pSer/pThr/pTyr-binding forkhead associated (FHA) protein